ncbi:GNAT family N-acetyltransferase [Agromyces archimandritae]|uniref:GNAT family N-acetyltransferase n=1 Tax=Agromyces archimandritae TaxID=2781962 RepID=A0A975FQG3_9MICO|nr:GNAT family N-acetyltransferase [Agromyces archimandritae]QTX05942.1 GNAT family N-acetyltransferase [Agromyces archimandritae]
MDVISPTDRTVASEARATRCAVASVRTGPITAVPGVGPAGRLAGQAAGAGQAGAGRSGAAPSGVASEPLRLRTIPMWHPAFIGLVEALATEVFDEIDLDSAASLIAMQRDARLERLCTGDATAMLIERGGEVIGYIVTAAGDGCLCILDGYVRPDARGRGIATAVLAEITSTAEAAGCPVEVELWAASPAIRLCRRFGFAEASAHAGHRRLRRMPGASTPA